MTKALDLRKQLQKCLQPHRLAPSAEEKSPQPQLAPGPVPHVMVKNVGALQTHLLDHSHLPVLR